MFLTDKLKQAGKKTLPFLLVGSLLNPLNSQEIKEEKRDWAYHALEASYITLNALDYFMTCEAISKGKEIQYETKELNPIAKHFLDNKPLLTLYKVGMNSAFLYKNRKLKKDHPRLAYANLIILDVVGIFLVYHEYKTNSRYLK